MIKKVVKVIVVIFMISLLNGCWDYQDINKRSILLAAGVDKVGKGVQLSGEVAKIAAIQKAEQGEASDVFQFAATGKNLEEARVRYIKELPYPLYFGAVRVAIIGSNYAREGLETYLMRIDKLYDYRKTVLTVISREPVEEILKVKRVKDVSVGFVIENIIDSLTSNGNAIYTKNGEIITDLALEKVGFVIPYIGIENDTIHYLGLAVMKGSRLVGTIKIEDTEGILYLLSPKPMLTENISLKTGKPNEYFLIVSLKDRKISTDYIDEQVVINIDMDLKVMVNYSEHKEMVTNDMEKELEVRVAEKAKKDIASIIKRAQAEFESDIFDFAKHFRAQHPKIYNQIDWEKEFVNSQVNVNVKAKIQSFNLIDMKAKLKFKDE